MNQNLLYILHLITLLGAIQGITLCIYLFPKKQANPKIYWYFVLFLFSLAIFNLSYAALMMGIDFLIQMPFPLQYLIGVGFFFFIKNHFPDKPSKKYNKFYQLLFLPAIIYGITRTYWFYLIVSGKNTLIIFEVYQTRFFTYNEFAYFFFNFFILIIILKIQYQKLPTIDQSPNNLKKWQFLKRFSYIFLAYNFLYLLEQTLTVLLDAEDNFILYSTILMLNSIFIYWIGFEGFSKNNFFLKPIKEKSIAQEKKSPDLERRLSTLMNQEEVFTDVNLKLVNLAQRLGISQKELSAFIRTHHQMSFSEYLNTHRVEKVKSLLKSPEAKQYTLVHLATQSGFNSKSSFNAVFKKMTGKTPKEYMNEG